MIQPTLIEQEQEQQQQQQQQQDIIPLTHSQPPQPPQTPVRLVDISITDDQVAFNLIVQFVQLAHKRGAYQMEESSKIWECLKRFQR